MLRRVFRNAVRLSEVLDGVEDIVWFLLVAGLLICLPVLFVWRAVSLHQWWTAGGLSMTIGILIYALRREWKSSAFPKLTAALFFLWIATTYVLRFFLE